MPYSEVTDKVWISLSYPIMIIIISVIIIIVMATIFGRRLIVPIKELVAVLDNVRKETFSKAYTPQIF